MAHEQKTHKQNFWLDTSLLPWWKNSHVPPEMMFTQVKTLTKMIQKFPLTLNFFWVVYIDAFDLKSGYYLFFFSNIEIFFV